MTWENDNSYVGEWKNDEMIGPGTFTFKDGTKYVCDKKDNQMNGKVTYFNDDYIYDGECVNG